MKKRGSHVGVVLSFVIFIIFLVFVYSILQPALKRQTTKQPVLDDLKMKLVENFSSNLTSVALKVGIDVGDTCVEFVDFKTKANLNDFHVVVKNESQNNATSYKRGSNLLIDRGSSTNKFFKVYQSENFGEIGEDGLGCADLTYGQNYSFGLIRTKEYVFESQVFELIDYYENNYENLKQEFDVPEGNEFGFSFELTNTTIIGTHEKNLSLNIYVEKFPMSYVDRNANINYGQLNVKVW